MSARSRSIRSVPRRAESERHHRPQLYEGRFEMTTRLFWITLAAASALFTATAPAQQIKLTLADQTSPTGWGPVNALQPWVKKVETATKDRIKIDIYPSQTLVKGPDIWKAVRAGTVDMGWG